MRAIVLDAFRRMRIRPEDGVYADQLRPVIESQILNWPCVALPDPENPVLVAGCVYALGVGEVWMVTGEGFKDQIRMVLPQVRSLCGSLSGMFGLHRLHMMVSADRPDAARFARHVGFGLEARLKCMGHDGSDVDVFLFGHESEVQNEVL